MEDFAREFRDEAPLASSTTRACRIDVTSGLSMDEFITALLSTTTNSGEFGINPEASK